VVVFGWHPAKADYKYGAFWSPKRGDEKYSWRFQLRFEEFERVVVENPIFWFRWGEDHRDKINSPCVYATFTYGRELGLENCWIAVGEDFNREVSYLRRRYGKVKVARFFESHEDGFPHIHAIFLFEEHSFWGFRYVNKKNNLAYGLDDFGGFKKGWSGGFVNAQLCNSVKGGFRYLKKYVGKASDGRDTSSSGLKTLALGWYFHKRSFSLSEGFRESYSNLINYLNSNSNRFHLYFRRLDDTKILDEVAEWHLYGVVRADVGWSSS
jgi:hypothetical protein